MVKARELPESLADVDLGVVDALKVLKQETDVLRERLAGLDSMKAEFDAEVFKRVQADYMRQAGAIEAKAEPMRQQARQSYARLRGALADIQQAHDAVKLDRQEIELRRKLGEFDEETYQTKLKDIEAALAERSAAHKQGEALRARFLEVFDSEDDLIGGHADPGPASTQEMPVALDPLPPPPAAMAAPPAAPPPPPMAVPAPPPSAGVPDDMPVAQTQILQVLKMPEPPKAPGAAGAKPAFGANATMSLRTGRLVPQNPEAGRSAIPLPPRPIFLGADAENEIRIGGPGVEPRHAQITADSKGFMLTDLGSKSGTRVNAEAIQQRMLRHEDVVQIGMARFVFREG